MKRKAKRKESIPRHNQRLKRRMDKLRFKKKNYLLKNQKVQAYLQLSC
jgi:hypothetical protein